MFIKSDMYSLGMILYDLMTTSLAKNDEKIAIDYVNLDLIPMIYSQGLYDLCKSLL